MTSSAHNPINNYPTSAGVSGLTGASGISPFLSAAVITAGAALWQREGHTSLMLPIMAGLLLISHLVRFRIEHSWQRYVCRAILFTLILVIYRIHPPIGETTFIDDFALNQFAELCVAEVVIRAWSRYTSSKYNRAILVLPVGIVFVVATNTYDDNVGRYFTPVFMVFLALALQNMRSAALPDAARRARLGVGISVACSAIFGAILYHALYANRDALTDWANRVLNGSNTPLTSTGLSDESHLASMFGRSGSYDRVLRIHASAPADFSYMRAYSMYTFFNGFWGPLPRAGARKFDPVNESDLRASEAGTNATVYRYLSSLGMVLAPLNTVSLGINGTKRLRWAKDDGGPLRFDIPGPDDYTMTIGPPGQQGLLCTPPDAYHLDMMLHVPTDVDQKVKDLANSIIAGRTDPLQKARAIESYLPSHHGYSQRIKVRLKDPLGDFLFSDKAAHCEFFASAAVILMRCAGVPARYVIGYYAHEEEDGDVVVRQRDAHAWAECWIKGTGWVTIDATPASGRPYGDVGTVPAWKHALEKMQDWFANIRRKLTPENFLRFAFVFACLAIAAVLIQNRYHFNWRRTRKTPVKEYALANEELRTLYGRFEVTCRRAGLLCPPNLPWQQYLSAALIVQRRDSVEGRPAETISAAADFIAEYDLARFGRGLNSEGYAALCSKLDALESLTKRVALEEKSI